MLRQEARHVLPRPVRCVPRVEQFSLRSVDQPHPGSAREEPPEYLRHLVVIGLAVTAIASRLRLIFRGSFLLRSLVCRFHVRLRLRTRSRGRVRPGRLPLAATIVAEPGPVKQAGLELARAQAHVVAPEKLEPDRLGALVLALAVALGLREVVRGPVLERDQRLVDLPRRDAALGQVRRELGAEISPHQPIARVLVGVHVPGLDQVVQPLLCFVLAAGEGVRGHRPLGERRNFRLSGFQGL